MNYIEVTILISRILIIMMLGMFIVLQWRVRKMNGLIGVLRRSVLWETSALVVLFIQTALFRYFKRFLNLPDNLVFDIVTLLVSLFVLVSFARGIKLFFDISSGKIDKDGKHH